jgi:hypothetical protein
MRARARGSRGLASLALAVLVATAPRAGGASGAGNASADPARGRAAAPVCARNCPDCAPAPDGPDLACAAEAFACRSEAALCEAKLAAYRAQMDELGAGVELLALPAAYARVLARFFPRLDLDAVRFGWSDRQPPDNAVTDCDRIYFARADFVARLRSGGLRAGSDWLWLLHELRHAEQCAILGGRDAYAARWLDELGTSFLADADLATLHDRIPMEGDADEHARRAFAALSRCCLLADGRLAPGAERGVASPPPVATPAPRPGS